MLGWLSLFHCVRALVNCVRRLFDYDSWQRKKDNFTQWLLTQRSAPSHNIGLEIYIIKSQCDEMRPGLRLIRSLSETNAVKFKAQKTPEMSGKTKRGGRR